MKRTIAQLTVIAVMAAGASLPASATANGGADTVEVTADLVTSVAPEDSTAGSPALVDATRQAGDDSDVNAGSAVAPADAGGAVQFPDAGVTVGLPNEADTGDAKITEDGLVVYPGVGESDASVAVAATSDSTSIQVVIPDESSSLNYTYELGAATAELGINGSAALINSDGEIVGFVEAPWAVDAAGNSVATHFEVSGNTLVQVVEPSAGTQFPVVADPDFIFFAKCAGGIALFAAENGAMMVKFWKVFKSTKQLVALFKSIRKMSKGSKITYLKAKLGSIASDLSGFGDLVSRCTP